MRSMLAVAALVVVFSLTKLEGVRASVTTTARNITDIPFLLRTHPFESHEKTWFVHTNDSERVERLTLDGVGPVFVSLKDSSDRLDASTAVRIRISGDDHDLLDQFTVATETFGSQHDVVQLTVGTKEHTKSASGVVLTDITLSRSYHLKSLTARGASDVAVDAPVLATNNASNNVTVVLAGAGDVVISMDGEHQAIVKNFVVSLSGSGNLHVSNMSFYASTGVVLAMEGSGNVNMVTSSDLEATKVSVDSGGAGNVCISAAGGIHANSIDLKASGVGNIALWTRNGSCTTQTVTISGVGGVQTGEVTCRDVRLALPGWGKAVVQAVDRIAVSDRPVGQIELNGSSPTSVDSPVPLGRVATNETGACRVRAMPLRTPAHVFIKGDRGPTTIPAPAGPAQSSASHYQLLSFPTAVMAVLATVV